VPAEFAAVWNDLRDVEGWLSDAQARRLWDRASALQPPAKVVEIGSYRGRSAIVLAKAAADGVEVVAIDPHAGNDRGPLQVHGKPEEGQGDHEVFMANLERAGVVDRVRHVRRRSQEALDAVDGQVDLLYIDGAHGYRPALEDIQKWGARVRDGGTMLIHDSWNAVGVTLAQLQALVPSGRFRYVGRSGSMSEYRRQDLSSAERVRNALRQLVELGYFVQSVAIKVALVAKQRRVARLLGHHTDADWPY
jgi:SAM-dependent methyltransferase